MITCDKIFCTYTHPLGEAKGQNLSIGVAPITQITYVRHKNGNIQGRSLNVIKVIFILSETAHKGKNSLPLGAKSFL